jgi:hypothetical protein
MKPMEPRHVKFFVETSRKNPTDAARIIIAKLADAFEEYLSAYQELISTPGLSFERTERAFEVLGSYGIRIPKREPDDTIVVDDPDAERVP